MNDIKIKFPNKWVSVLLILLISLGSFSCKEDRGLVVGKIKKASKLATTEFTISKIVYGVKRKKLLWAVNLNEAKFIAHSKAIVKAGIDLEKLKKEDVDIDGTMISLKLPAVEIINFSYPSESFQKDSLISGDAFLNKINLKDQEEFFQDAEIDIRNSLQYMDIVSTTEKKTRIMLETMLKSLGYTEVYIDFYEGRLIAEIQLEETP